MKGDERLQKFLARAGIASRRKAETLIEEGRVRVNGRIVTTLGTKINPKQDRVDFDGKRVVAEPIQHILLHKPPGTICSTHDPEGRETVLDLLGHQTARLYPVGRLDYATSGVLLLTNDGALADALLHPRNEVPRTYHVKVRGEMRDDELDPLREGVVLEGRRLKAEASMLAKTDRNAWLEMTIRQGVNHQIHRMLEHVERDVLKLIRVSFGGLRCDDLRPAEHRPVRLRELNALRKVAGLAPVKSS